MIIIDKINNKHVLGVNVGIPNKGTAGTDFSERRKDPGYILTDSGIKEFKLPEITELDDKIILYSNNLNFDLKPLIEDRVDIRAVQKLLNFYMALKEMDVTLPVFSSNMFYTLENGDILMMPPSIIEFINNRESLAKKLSDVSVYRHPDLNGEKSILYAIGILLFKATTNSYPIIFTDVEDLRDKMRRKKLVQPRWKNIEISDSLNSLIIKLFDIETTLDIPLTFKKLNDIVDSGLYREEGDYSEEAEINKQKENSLLKWEERRAFGIKHRGYLIGSTLLTIVLLSFFGTIINNALKPPATSGFTSHQVVETYFESFQTLNPELIDDVLGKGVRKNDSTEISTLYVTSKMRTQTDPTATIISPQKWLMLEDEEKAITNVYGIYNLEIDTLEDNVYKVSYEKWYTQPDDGDMSEEVVLGIYKLVKEEIFTLEETKYSFKIIKIETLVELSERVW